MITTDFPAELFDALVTERRSTRAFKSDALSESLIAEVFAPALRAPSNCNTQPWFAHVVTGEALETLRTKLPEHFARGDVAPDIPYDGSYEGVFKDRQYASARALYSALGIPREDRAARQQWFLKNFSFFGAPAVCFFYLPAGFGLREACDLGMFTQTVMLSLAARGLGSCPQTALGFMAHVIREALNIPDDRQLMFGLSFGYPDDSAPGCQVVTERAVLEDVLTFHR